MLERIIRILNTEKNMFENSILQLLDSCTNFSNVEDLVQEPAADLWREEPLHDSFQAWLGRSFDVFTSIVMDMTNTFRELSEKLGLDTEYRVNKSCVSNPCVLRIF